MGTQSSEESPDSSEDDLYQGGVGMNSGERQCEQNRVMQLSQTVRSPITTLLGHSGVVISCGKSSLRILRYLAHREGYYPDIFNFLFNNQCINYPNLAWLNEDLAVTAGWDRYVCFDELNSITVMIDYRCPWTILIAKRFFHLIYIP